MRTLVTGATGRIGSRLVPRLLTTRPVRVVVRDVERAGRYWDLGCDVVLGDLREPEVVQRAVAGMDAVVHLAADEVTGRLARAAAEAGVTRFVVASPNLVGELSAGERALLDLYHRSGLGVRIVRLASVYGAGDPLPRVAGGSGYRRIPTVHHADAGQALRLALAADGIDGRVFAVADDAGVVDTRRIRTELGYAPLFPTVRAAQAAGAL